MTVGAKALYDLYHHYPEFDPWALMSKEHYAEGGLWGGLLAYFCFAVPLAMLLSKHKHAALDLLALSIPIPWIFAKLACLFNGCCYGRPSSMPWAITFPEGDIAPASVPLHPTQIYEMLVIVCILLVFKLLKYERWQGTMLLWFLILYGFGRAVTDTWRGDVDASDYIGPFNITQIICLSVATISLIALCLWRRYLRKRDRIC
jgi:phosphatidylglycerol:prolipoprotein diacylglycerol transferase